MSHGEPRNWSGADLLMLQGTAPHANCLSFAIKDGRRTRHHIHFGMIAEKLHLPQQPIRIGDIVAVHAGEEGTPALPHNLIQACRKAPIRFAHYEANAPVDKSSHYVLRAVPRAVVIHNQSQSSNV